ncbi:MAG: gluconate 2-dehydrogenase subunit 3 family protein [Terriglobia bacterium]
MRKLNRRKFMQIAATAAVAPAASCTKTISPWRFLTLEEARTLGAICEQIVPADKDAGATQAGVVNFIDRQLVGYLRRHQRAYREGLIGVDQSSLARHGGKFADLPAEKQLAVLTALEKGEAAGEVWKRSSAKAFFDLVVNHTMQGFYGDPRHGGNRDGVSWKMLDLPYPPIRGRQQYDLTKPGEPA